MSQFVVCYATGDEIVARLHAFVRGEGSVRDHNHVVDIVRAFVKDNNDTSSADHVIEHSPDEGWRWLYEVWMDVSDTRRGGSTYSLPDFRMHPRCPHDIAVSGHDIYMNIKRLLRRERNERKRNTK